MVLRVCGSHCLNHTETFYGQLKLVLFCKIGSNNISTFLAAMPFPRRIPPILGNYTIVEQQID